MKDHLVVNEAPVSRCTGMTPWSGFMSLRRAFGLILILACADAAARDKTDQVTLINGNQLTGEIKKLDHGQLSFSTDSMGTVRIEWDDVRVTDSQYEFEFELSDGSRYFGRLGRSEEPGYLVIVEQFRSVPLSMAQIIRITPIENSFLDRLNGSLSLGLNLTKGDDVSDQFNVSASATHRTRIRAITAKLSAIITQDDEESTQRADLSLEMTRFRGNRWFNSYFAGLESNDELDLDLRTSIGAGVGRYVIQTNAIELQWLTGLVATSERLGDGSSSVEGLEGLLGIGFSKYLYDHPNVDIDLSLNVFPSLTESGRVRSKFNARIRREIVDDLFLDITLFASYDSDPQSVDGATTDQGIVTSLGWSF